jgi:hypothetical protein
MEPDGFSEGFFILYAGTLVRLFQVAVIVFLLVGIIAVGWWVVSSTASFVGVP